MNRIFLTRIFLLLIALVVAVPTFAQDPDDKKNDPDSLNEQSIYIPYDKLREVFERDGRGVFLPYDKFQQLWKEARDNRPTKTPTTAPLGALITDIESTATLGKEIVSVDATIKIELLKEGWHRVPLRLANAAIRTATIDGKEARIVSENNQYELLVSHDSDDSKTIKLQLSYAKGLTKTGGQSVVGFQAPQSPVNRWTIRTGQKDIDVQIEPMIASTKKTDAEGGDDQQGDEILAFVGAAPEVKILWTPKSEGASGLDALVSADTQTQFRVDQGVARTSASITLDVSRSEISQVSVTVPADQKVVSVFDRNVKKWDVKKTKDGQAIEIELFEPTLGRQSLLVEMEKFVDELDETTLSVPTVKINDASRNSGILLVSLTSGVRAEPEKKSGLLQMDDSELPAALKQLKPEFAYRYASLPFTLSLNLKKIQPQIHVDQLVEVAVRPEKLTAELSAVFDIQLAGVFQVELDIPSEFEIKEIRPLSREGINSIPVDTFYREKGDGGKDKNDSKNKNRVVVMLEKKATGKIGLLVSLERDLTKANLLSPTDEAAKIQFEIPKAFIDGIEFSKGNLIVYAPESLQVNAAETTGLRSESFNNSLARHVTTINTSGVRQLLAYSFAHTDAMIELSAKRRRPQVTVDQSVVVTVQSGVVTSQSRLLYEVRYSGVKSLRLDVPTQLTDELRFEESTIHHEAIEPQPDDLAEGYTAWKLTSDGEFFGKQAIGIKWETKIADLPLGESAQLPVDRLIPRDVDRSRGQIVLTKSETIDVRPDDDVSGLRPIDPQTDLRHGTGTNSAMAFEFVDDWSLNLVATRFELQELKRTSISRSVVRVVALRQNELSFQCLYQMRSVGQRVSIQMPAGFDGETSFDDQPIRVNGRRVTPERGGNDLIYVPLTAQESNQSFLLDLRFTIPGNPHQIDLPLFTDNPAVQKVYLCVYLPFERALLHQSGEWTDEAVDEHTRSIAGLLSSSTNNSIASRMFRRRTENVQQYLNWVAEGVPGGQSVDQKFETDGRPYVFSALRPEPAPAGSLQLRTINITLLNGLVIGVMLLLGLLLLRCRVPVQIAGALLALAAMFFLGVFFPLVTEHLFSEALLLSAALIGLTWLVFDLIRWIRKIQLERRENQATMFAPVSLATDGGEIEVTPEGPLEDAGSDGGDQ